MKCIRTKMSKELTPLKALSELYNYAHSYDDLGIEEADELYELVATPLKALEIIKEKPIVALVDYKYTYEEWLELVDEKDKDLFKNKEEYDLLKEVLL